MNYGDGLGVVTVTYSPGETLAPFVDTLAKATTRPVQVILADNGSVDGVPEAVAASREGVRLVPTGGNLGYGGGANRGVAALGPDVGWVLISNPDIEFLPGSVDALIDAAERWPTGGMFGPLIREPSGEVYPSARLLPSIGRGLGHALFAVVWKSNPWTRAYRQEQAPVERPAEWLSGSCFLMRRSVFDAVGGFDERYFMYFEDVDLGERVGRAGYLNVYVPDAEVVHIGGHSTARASDRMLREHHLSAYRYLADRHPGVLWAPFRAAVKVGLALRVRLLTRS